MPGAAVVTSCLCLPGWDPLERGGSTARERDLHARAADPPHPPWDLPWAASHPQQGLCTQVRGGSTGWGDWQGPQWAFGDVHPHRDLKPTNVLLDEDDQPVLMDLGSMNQARIEVNSSREAMAVQVGGLGHHPTRLSLLQSLHPYPPLCRTGLPSAAPSPTVPPSSSQCRASAS